MKKYLLGLATVLTLSAFGCTSSGTTAIKPIATSTPAVTTAPTTPTPSTSTVYRKGTMSVTIPAGWTATEAVQKSETGPAGSPVVTTSPNPDAVNITNGKWILYINTNASQASGVEGGRFAEIAMGSPSADAVVTEQPNTCGEIPTLVPAYGDFKRADLSVSAADKTDWCATPTNGKTVWFFSYITKADGGYFNYYTPGTNSGLVITMSYNTSVVNDLPEMGSADLTAALKQMTDIASTLVVKGKIETK